MKKIHHVWVSVYSKPEDEEEVILENLRKLFPYVLEDEKLKVERKSAISFEERKIVIFKVHLEKQRHIKKWVDFLKDLLKHEQKELLLRQKESRLDEGNHFFIRFDKDRLIKSNEFFITDEGNCYHIKMSIAAFPTTRDNALKVVEELFSNF